MNRHVTSDPDSEFGVHLYRPSDRAAVASLYERVRGGDGSAWLSWKYEDNPYLTHVPMSVVTADGRVVAVSPAVALELRVGNQELLALQLTDGLVDPEFRGTDAGRKATRHLQAVYADRDPELFFHVGPGGGRSLGDLRRVSRLSTAYRAHSLRGLVPDDASRTARTLARFLGPVERLSHRLRDAEPEDGYVTRSNHVPTRTLTGLAREHHPSGLHAVRDPRYLAWRFGNPEWSYTTYLAGETGVRAAAVVGKRRAAGREIVALTDIYPPAVEPRTDAVTRILQTVVADNPRADWLVADGGVLPRQVRRRTGFQRDDARPLSWLLSPVTLSACPATGPDPDASDWDVEGRSLTDPANWHLSLAERDGW